MTRDSRLNVGRGLAAAAAIALLVAGAAAMYLIMRAGGSGDGKGTPPTSATSAEARSRSAQEAGDARLQDVVVPLAQEAADRAGIKLASVSTQAAATSIRLPGVVEPNAYRQVAVTPLVAGRVIRISAELGDRVRRGQTMARIYSPELAEAQTRYVAARAMLDAHDRELQRTEKLLEIGAASRQELERIHAEHAAQTAEVQTARARLELLGVPAAALDNLAAGKDVGATTSVPAPLDGVVTERLANTGLNVDPAARLFTVVDLSNVWVIADLYEKDFARVRVGNGAIITTTAYPDLRLEGRISYIDPQVNPDTRTARLRVEVPNTRGELRLGMYADVTVTGGEGASATVVPRSAVQNVGNRTVVYLANPKEPGRFTEREVRLGEPAGNVVEVLSGVRPGDIVATEGSFSIRAERERLGLRAGTAAAGPADSDASRSADRGVHVQEAKIVVGEHGYAPATITLKAGVPARLTFLRTTDKTCGTEVVFPSLHIKRPLPLNDPVVIEFTPPTSGEIGFVCGMNMLKGVVVAR
jgi:membrane fusion protein, heavy metal efflux system